MYLTTKINTRNILFGGIQNIQIPNIFLCINILKYIDHKTINAMWLFSCKVSVSGLIIDENIQLPFDNIDTKEKFWDYNK